jgi:molecular chaperone HscB
MACWSCERPEGEGLFCESCGAIQPARSRTHFEMVGLTARFDLDLAMLEQRYKDLSRRLHPDRHARGDARARRFSLQQSTALNEAYRVLRDPRRRAEYLIQLWGVEIDSDRASRTGRRTVKPGAALLAEMLELGERIADAKAEGRGADVEAIARDVRARHERAFAAVERDLCDTGATEPDEAGVQRIAERLASLRYLDRFLADAEGGGDPQ